MILQFPEKQLTSEQKQKLEDIAKREQRIKEADERVNKGQATEEDIDLYLEEFTCVIDALEKGKLEFITPPTQVYKITLNR